MSIKLNITACDNELIAVAFKGDVSYEICRISSGNNNTVDVTISIGAGKYDKSIVRGRGDRR